MARKKPCECPSPPLSQPFWLMTFADMVTLILCYFVLMYALSTLQLIKFEAQIGTMRGALGISKLYSHAPMQKSLPAPAVKQSRKVIAKSAVKPSTLQPLGEFARVDLTEPVQTDPNDAVKMMMQAVGIDGELNVAFDEADIVIVLPSFNLFAKGEYTIDPQSIEVQRLMRRYNQMGQMIAKLIEYDISFIGHTDETPISYRVFTSEKEGFSSLKNNMELGFMRALALYQFFFKEYLTDQTRLTFASRGDTAPLVADARFDSDLRRNRRVEIVLRKRKPKPE